MQSSGNAHILRLNQELRMLKREPLPNIWISPVKNDITHIIALIMGPSDTPYQYGFFVFDMRFPSSYPFQPPAVVLLTTDDGKVRFNPNLYANGKVCLSILGTWSGPQWTSAESISSVLLSIQSLMNTSPYHNEPGFEKERRSGDAKKYNERIIHETLRVAVCSNLELISKSSTLKEFRHIIESQFMLWYDKYHSGATNHISFDNKAFEDPFGSTGNFNYSSIVTRLEKIKATLSEDYKSTTRGSENPELKSHLASHAITNVPVLLAREAKLVEEANLQGISAGPREDDPYIWDITVFGQEGTMWEGGIFSAEMLFHSEYPLQPPVINFTSNMFHPNISPSGLVCLDLLACDWTPNTPIVFVLLSLQSLLIDPNLSMPINSEACDLYCKDLAAYKKKVRRLAVG